MLKYILELSVFFVLLPFIYFLDLVPGLWKFLPIVFFFSYCLFILFNNKELNKSDFKISHIPITQWLKMLIFPIVFYWYLLLFSLKKYLQTSQIIKYCWQSFATRCFHHFHRKLFIENSSFPDTQVFSEIKRF